MPELLMDVVFLIGMFSILMVFLFANYLVEKKKAREIVDIFKDNKEDALKFLEKNSIELKRIADALEKKNDGK